MAGTDMKLEAVTLPVADVDRAKGFYQGLGWRLDADIAVGDAFRVVQFTPPHSDCSVAFGKGVTTGEPGSVQRLLLAVHDIDAARADASRADLLQETALHHDHYEKTHAPHNWWDWYGAYMVARDHGSTPQEAARAADRYMEDVLDVAALR
jgi:catechol 2,3-dioxygenase-like lactoylglutathione lyase family enzyme